MRRLSGSSPAAGRCHHGNSHSAATAPDYGPEQDTGRRAPDAGALDRRLTLICSYIDSVSQAEPVAMKRLMKGLDEFLERDQDRALFDLAPRPKGA